MSRIYIDAGAWIGLAVRRDAHHPAAQRFFEEHLADQFVTSNLVLAEIFTFCRYRRHNREARQIHALMQQTEQQGRLEVVWVTREIHESAWEIYDRYDDQAFSFTDCSSFVIARRENVDFVFGFDADFRIMGFDLRP